VLLLLTLLLGLTPTTPLPAQAGEICGNQVDDDGDGLIDCEDDECSFSQFTDIAVGNSDSRGFALGDVDGDGDLDAWVANFNQPNLVWINDGELQGGTPGVFTDSGQSLGDSYSYDVALGDLDGDGDLDAWVVNSLAEANRVWINDGGLQGGTAGHFSDSDQALGNSSSQAISLGDLDGDGDLDAWVANHANQPNRIWINDGLGNFTDSGQALGNSTSVDVALGDLDGDGDLDAWVVNTLGPPDRVWVNDGFGTFTDSNQDLNISNSQGVALGDVDGDGDLDAWVAVSNFPNRVWQNDGLGNFTDSGQQLGSAGYTGSVNVSLGDLDGDGDLDAWVANFVSQSDRIWQNDGLGNFSDSGLQLGNFNSVDVALGDLDGDGNLDAWVSCHDQPNHVFINQGPCFRRGDGNGDGAMNISDAVHTLGYLFGTFEINCFDASDANDDGTVNLSDPIYLLGYLFNAGPDPLAPFPSCDLDPTDDFLGCENYDGC
jgi:hypothetical protein